MTVLLFDQNLSFRLPELLVQLFPNAEHVRDVGLGRADDLAIWEYAAAHGAAIVTKDDDFRRLSFCEATFTPHPALRRQLPRRTTGAPMYYKSAQGEQREPTPSQGVNVIKAGTPAPPKPLRDSTIQRIREAASAPPPRPKMP